MDSFVFIEPGATNRTEQAEDGHWKIMFTENGRTRHLNDAKSKSEGEEKARKTADKRNVPFVTDPVTQDVVEDEVIIDDPDNPLYLRMVKPRGAPPLGSIVEHRLTHLERTRRIKVTGYLSDQFYGEDDSGGQFIVHMNEDWSIQAGRE
jgi:hypothetical protein